MEFFSLILAHHKSEQITSFLTQTGTTRSKISALTFMKNLFENDSVSLAKAQKIFTIDQGIMKFSFMEAVLAPFLVEFVHSRDRPCNATKLVPVVFTSSVECDHC
jgi:hypothetical protein